MRSPDRILSVADEKEALNPDVVVEDFERRTRVHGGKSPHLPYPEFRDGRGRMCTVTRSQYYAATGREEVAA